MICVFFEFFKSPLIETRYCFAWLNYNPKLMLSEWRPFFVCALVGGVLFNSSVSNFANIIIYHSEVALLSIVNEHWIVLFFSYQQQQFMQDLLFICVLIPHLKYLLLLHFLTLQTPQADFVINYLTICSFVLVRVFCRRQSLSLVHELWFRAPHFSVHWPQSPIDLLPSLFIIGSSVSRLCPIHYVFLLSVATMIAAYFYVWTIEKASILPLSAKRL